MIPRPATEGRRYLERISIPVNDPRTDIGAGKPAYVRSRMSS